MKFIFTILLILSSTGGFCQAGSISGIVSDAENKPMLNCNVFISNSGRGTVTDEFGKFSIRNLVNGSFSLVVSYTGYETYTFTFSADQLPLNLNIRLRKKVVTMDNVFIVPVEKDGWERWGRLFSKCFLGESASANDCIIENSNILKFYRRDSLLEATAQELLVISNHHLGYRIRYQLEKFEFDLKNQRIVYMGYPLFEELDSNYAFPAKYARRRVKAYQGSLTHFLRSLYRNTLAEEGFEIRRMQRHIYIDTVKNTVKLTAKQRRIQHHMPPAYHLKQRVVDSISDSLLTRDSLLERDQSGTPARFSFEDFLTIKFLKEPEPSEYVSDTHRFKPSKSQSSCIFISNVEKRVELSSNGFYFPPLDLSMEGFFGWERVGDLLPAEYESGLSPN